MLTTLEGTERILVTRTIVEDADLFEQLPQEFKDTITEVHYVPGVDRVEDSLGLQGTFGIDLDEEWRRKIGEASNLVDLVTVDPRRLGAVVDDVDDTDAEKIEDWIEAEKIDASEPVEPKMWNTGPVTDQGQEGACVGHAGTSFLTNSPIRTYAKQSVGWLNNYAYDLYKEAQRYDEWEGTNYSGTSVNAMLKRLIAKGHAETFGYTTDFPTIMAWKRNHGPLVMSLPWYEGCYRTDANGRIQLTGKHVGAHAMLDVGFTQWRAAHFKNSWGLDYGLRGIGIVGINVYRQWINRGARAYACKEIRK